MLHLLSLQEKSRAVRELTATVLSRPPKMCNFIEWQDKKVIYKRYASLFFIACVDKNDNELIVLEQIHLFVEVLDRYFGNVCELDIIFNFHKAYYILDELFIGGHLQETSKVGCVAVFLVTRFYLCGVDGLMCVTVQERAWPVPSRPHSVAPYDLVAFKTLFCMRLTSFPVPHLLHFHHNTGGGSANLRGDGRDDGREQGRGRHPRQSHGGQEQRAVKHCKG